MKTHPACCDQPLTAHREELAHLVAIGDHEPRARRARVDLREADRRAIAVRQHVHREREAVVGQRDLVKRPVESR